MLNLQTTLTRHFNGGWDVGAPDLPQSYDFEKAVWTTNLGAQVGTIFPLGYRSMQIFSAVYYNSKKGLRTRLP